MSLMYHHKNKQITVSTLDDDVARDASRCNSAAVAAVPSTYERLTVSQRMLRLSLTQ
jgi:hypothetical protein